MIIGTPVYGEMKPEPVRYTFEDHGDGKGTLRSKSGSITGDNEDLARNMERIWNDGHMRILSNPHDLVRASRPPRRGFWDCLWSRVTQRREVA